jgi:PilZ domain
MSELKDESERSPRKRTLKTGRIVFNNRNSTIDCTVRNLSKHGALLLLPHIVEIPDDFELHVDGVRHTAHVVWRSNGQLGVTWK